ncbi:MAG: translation initiation factor IF-2 [Thermoplasmata archaeon]|nr:MAG: translation initiation factor IF-2 [Thermoplasmata archaeon]
MKIRQPIVSVLGHVDHGKTTLLDYIRGTTIVSREAGRITQHIGATEVPLDVIMKICGPLAKGKKFKVPGLLFIDTPGHHAFTTLRARGGSLADLAVLVVDIIEGVKPQTVESLKILRTYKTPFVVALNKIDRIQGWRSIKGACFHEAYNQQEECVKNDLDNRIYEFSSSLYKFGFSADRYDRIQDFQRNVALIPICAKSGEGVPDLLLILVGLAQRFLEKRLETEDCPAMGTVLEVKEERGLGPTMDVIIYRGVIRRGDTIVVGGKEPIITKVRALLKPRALDEIRDPRYNFENVAEASAAVGVKILAQDIEGAVAGAPLRVVGDDNIDDVIREVSLEAKPSIEFDPEGLFIKADAIGSLEALAKELNDKGVGIWRAEVGDVSKKDIVECSTVNNPIRRVILAFNVRILPDAELEIENRGVHVISGNIIYRLIEDYFEWYERVRKEFEMGKRIEITHPGKIKILPGCVFRQSKPAIVGVRVLGGRIRPGQRLIRDDGRVIGKIKSIQSEGKSLKEAANGQEVAIAIEGATVGRHVRVEDVLYVDIPEGDVRKLLEGNLLNDDEMEILEELIKIKRKSDQFWGI